MGKSIDMSKSAKTSKASAPKTSKSTKKDFVLMEKPAAAAILLFTKCGGKVSLIIGLEKRDKWGTMFGRIEEGAKEADIIEAIFNDKLGMKPPKIEKVAHCRHRNTDVVMVYSSDCVDKIKSNAKLDRQFKDIKLIPIADIHKFVANPSLDLPVLPGFLTLMIQNKTEVDKFVKSLGK